MKNMPLTRFGLLAVFMLLAMTVWAQAPGQSLADAARKARATKPATTASASHVYNNDNLPKEGTIAVVGVAREAPAAATTSAGDSAAGGDSKAEKAKAESALRDKVNATKNEIAQLERELSILQRENQIRVAEYYGDAGAQMQNQRAFLDKDRQYKADIAAKQAAMDAAKAKLDDLREQARKSGVPASAVQ